MMEKQEPFSIGGVVVQPGERRFIDLALARLYTHTELKIPLHVIHGRRPGPRLLVCAAIHGDEILGVEIIRRLLKRKVLGRLRGTLIAIPIVNVFGFINHSRYSPDRRDLNRFFPGSEGGSFTSRMARLFMDEVVSKCTHGIDIHAGSHHRENLPQVRVSLGDPALERMAFAFGTPVILQAEDREGSLRHEAKDMGLRMLVYEAGEVLRFDELAIRGGIRGIISVMREIGMLPASRETRSRVKPVIARSSTWVRAPISGILRTGVRLGDRVARNSRIGAIADPFGEAEQEIISPATGIVIGRLNLPLVHRGDAIFHVARFDRSDKVTDILDVFKEEIQGNL